LSALERVKRDWLVQLSGRPSPLASDSKPGFASRFVPSSSASVAAEHPGSAGKSTLPSPSLSAPSLQAAGGGGVPAPSRTHLATDGLPLGLSVNSMYQPGGETLAFGGAIRFAPLAVAVKRSSTWRCCMSFACVVAPGAIRTARVIALLVSTANGWFQVRASGAAVIAGRGPEANS
jgi:hypothetical protein